MIKKCISTIKDRLTALRSSLAGSSDQLIDKISPMTFEQQQQLDLFLEQYASFIRAQAIEQAAIKVDQWNVYRNEEYDKLAQAIRNLK